MTINMKLHKYFAWACALLLSCSVAACSDDDDQALLRPAVDIESNSTTVSSLTFWWPDRDDAASWHYVFKDANGNVLAEEDLPRNHARLLVFTGLQPDSNYTLEVTAIAEDGSMVTTVYTARTNAVVQLATPTVTSSQDGYTVTITWQAVSNAASYTYQILNADGSVYEEGSTTATSLEYDELELGNYSVRVQALANQEAYSDSEVGTLDFERVLGRMVTSPGTYTTANGTVLNPSLVYMEDGSYIIENFRGIAGYDLTFTVSRKKVHITNGTDQGTTVAVPAGDGTNVVYSQDVSAFDGDQYEGSITFKTANGDETYTWETLVLPSFDVTLYGYIYMTGYSSDYSDEFEIPAEARNGVITIDNFLGSKNTVTLTYDREAGTATTDLPVGFSTGYFNVGNFPPLKYIYYYGSDYCSYEPDYDDIVIRFYGYVESGAYYWSYLYIYIDNID